MVELNESVELQFEDLANFIYSSILNLITLEITFE